MDAHNLLEANHSLEERVNLLEARLSSYKRLFKMSNDLIDSFSHFIPEVVIKYKIEVENEFVKMQNESREI